MYVFMNNIRTSLSPNGTHVYKFIKERNILKYPKLIFYQKEQVQNKF